MLKFRGASNLSIDVKGRIVLPARYRERLSEICDGQLVITIDSEQPCLLIYPLNEWEIVEDKINALPSFNPVAKNIQRKLIGYAEDVKVNNSGRLLLPGPLRKIARLDKKALLIGQGNKFELWDEEQWEALCEQEVSGEIPEEVARLTL